MSTTDALLREVAILYTHAQRTTAACCDVKSQTQCMVVTELGRHQPLTPLELAERLGFEKSWMSRVIAQLVDEGLILRQPHQTDGRSHLLYLTPEGETRFEQLNQILNAHAERIIAAIPPDERGTVIYALTLVRDALRQEAESIDELILECTIA